MGNKTRFDGGVEGETTITSFDFATLEVEVVDAIRLLFETNRIPQDKRNNSNPKWVEILTGLRAIQEKLEQWLNQGSIMLSSNEVAVQQLVDWGEVLQAARSTITDIKSLTQTASQPHR